MNRPVYRRGDLRRLIEPASIAVVGASPREGSFGNRLMRNLGRFRGRLHLVNGRYDATFPYESAQLPFFRMLGTPAADKRHVVFDTPHDVRLRRTDLVREVLDWYDKYLGRVQ